MGRHKTDTEYAAMVEQDFPPALLEPWQARVKDETADWPEPHGWTASMLPLLGAEPPTWTLRWHGSQEGVGISVSFSGLDQDKLLWVARAYRAPWWS